MSDPFSSVCSDTQALWLMAGVSLAFVIAAGTAVPCPQPGNCSYSL